ncbi:VOC family protein [Defluviimonas sp. WL0075]|uniref:VOC family protein n=2 Tax=Albidovulum sediminicola TaxID=2984331 RepID=A0ABT2Z2Q6_9RHOB|nr:VOC family protein [Defluviimonas sp. WL0075]
MFHYLTVGTNDLDRARRFYDAVMPTLGFEKGAEREEEIGYRRPGEAMRFWVTRPFDGRPATVGNGSMPAFEAPDRAAVDAFHRAGLAQGGSDEGAPGVRPYGAHFYACYLRDPDGNKLSALCLREADG